ncbi:unnamed protein product [Cylindrotheca closterium]|uniref:NIDO domain-containing protein n=1 Tax=Cylindrotheca closterium TaxID=2856 RepID=A0AAD2GF04_9STRA|nr:unnamed protein product [Cylindrotheca closterium]
MKLSFATFLLSVAAQVPVAQGEDAFAEPLHAIHEDEEIHFAEQGCVDLAGSGWSKLPKLDDQPQETNTGIVFDWFGTSYLDDSTAAISAYNAAPSTDESKSYIFINDNGNLSFGGGLGFNRPTGFAIDGGTLESQWNMIAPFWSDVDISGGKVDGNVYFKTVLDENGQGSKFVVTWKEVAKFGGDAAEPKVNSFQVVLSDFRSADPKICFCYCQMEWATTSEDSFLVKDNDFEPATVGINPANGITDINNGSVGLNKFLLGTFSTDTKDFGGYGSLNNGVKYLHGKGFCFDPEIVFQEKPTPTVVTSGACGDPHFKTWKNEHFEYHGQCDLVLTKDDKFADGLGLDVHIRTKLVRFWSYIKNAVIRIGDDVLEIEGSAMEGIDKEVHYWINYEYQGELTEFAGFPVTISSEGTKSNKNYITIDLNSKYPGQKIVLSTFKEFVKVDFKGATAAAFGNTVGMLGDYKTGKTVARDGATVLDNYSELGHEWQVLPSDGKYFREASEPQFPKKCIDPEDPQGERRRRLAESTISMEQAESACAGLKDALDRKDCVYDILATQDMDMAGAF